MEYTREQIDAIIDENERLREALEYMDKSCLCERFKTKGFDYGQNHKRMGKCDAGGRWITPRDKAKQALNQGGE